MSSATSNGYSAVRAERQVSMRYDVFIRALESSLGVTRPELVPSDPSKLSQQEARKLFESFVGSSGFSLFQKLDHGFLRQVFANRPGRVALYFIGNGLIAVEMTKHDARAGLYVPLRLLVEEVSDSLLRLTYDLPSAAMAQFHRPDIDSVARQLDEKFERLIESAASAGRGGKG
jgi:uncharacterized protein (DUF302 family)